MHPIELDATLKLAKSKLRSGNVPEAEAMYRKVLERTPDCAEAVHFLGLAAMQRGKLDEALPLVRKSIEMNPQEADYHNNLATVLGKMGQSIEALGAAQQAIDLKADFPEAYGNKGVAMEQLGRPDEAIEAYRKAAELRADHVDALANLGNALSRKGEHEEAITCLRKFADLRPRNPDARKQLGNALRRAGRPKDAITAYRMAVEMNPKDADAYNNLGAALQESGRVPEAEEILRTCLSINPNHSDAHWNRGLALLAMGQWREGWMEYEWRQHLKEDVGQKRSFPQPTWKGSPLAGRTLLVLCEQGLGDTIQFIRYAPLLARQGARVIVECQSKLRPLLQGLVEERDAGMGRRGDAERDGRRQEAESLPIQVIAKGEPLPNFDMHARLLTLPGIMDSTPESVPAEVPYLHVDKNRVDRLGTLLSGKRRGAETEFRVGLVWQGNTAHKGDKFRSIALEKFSPLANVPGVRLVSLQKGFGSEQIEKHREELKLIEWSDPADTTAEALVETAALMKNLDLVIAVDTSIAHLAGALGVPVWVAMPLASDWRWLLDREDTPWYPTMRLFRQRELGDWDEVIARMTAALRETVADKEPLAKTAKAARIAGKLMEVNETLGRLEEELKECQGDGNGDGSGLTNLIEPLHRTQARRDEIGDRTERLVHT
jgi:tetratricopeptide (TPR) repeat protein